MTTANKKHTDSRFPRYQWLVEVLVFASLTPALVFGVHSIGNLPIT